MIDELAKKLKSLQKDGQKNTWQTFLYAAAIKDHYAESENEEHKNSFSKWYRQHDLRKFFGTKSQFYKCAAAGNTIAYFAKNFPDTDEDLVYHLPTSMNALYEISLLLDQKTKEHIKRLCYGGGVKDPEDNKQLALITPIVSAAEIKAYRENGSKKRKTKVQKSAREQQYNIPIATIYANKSLYDFDKRGKHKRDVDLRDIKSQIQSLAKLNGNQFDVRDNLSKIERLYKKKEAAADPVAKVKAKRKKRQ